MFLSRWSERAVTSRRWHDKYKLVLTHSPFNSFHLVRFTLLLTLKPSVTQRDPLSKKEQCTEQSNLQRTVTSCHVTSKTWEIRISANAFLFSIIFISSNDQTVIYITSLILRINTSCWYRGIICDALFSRASHLSGDFQKGRSRGPIRHIDVDIWQLREGGETGTNYTSRRSRWTFTSGSVIFVIYCRLAGRESCSKFVIASRNSNLYKSSRCKLARG